MLPVRFSSLHGKVASSLQGVARHSRESPARGSRERRHTPLGSQTQRFKVPVVRTWVSSPETSTLRPGLAAAFFIHARHCRAQARNSKTGVAAKTIMCSQRVPEAEASTPTEVEGKLDSEIEALETAFDQAPTEDADDKTRLAQPVAVLVLGLVTIFWGAQHSALRAALSGTDALEAAALNCVRFSLAAACFVPWLPELPPWNSKQWAPEWRAGIELGLWLFLGFGLQTVGLLYTTAQRSVLLLYLNVKLVPFFAQFLFGQQVQWSAWLSAAAAFFGTFLVAGDGASGLSPNIGDGLSLAAAAASAMFILRLETFASATEPKALNAVNMLVVASLSALFTFAGAIVSSPPDILHASPDVLLAYSSSVAVGRITGLISNQLPTLVYLGVITTGFTSWLQTIGQRSVSATTASAIYALDPLWGCLFAYLLLDEKLGLQGLAGCAVLATVWVVQFISAWASESAKDEK